MSQHTPGPWYDDDDGCIYARAREHDSDSRNRNWDIARVNLDEKYITDPPLDVAYANSRLLAAAPDLLAALQRLLDSLCDSDIDDLEDHDLGQGHDVAGCVLCEARAAIARATGE